MFIPGQILEVNNFLTVEECDTLIDLSETQGYEEAAVQVGVKQKIVKNTRDNDRCIYFDEVLAESLWPRLIEYADQLLPEWQPIGLNECFRFYRYNKTQRFKLHLDGYHERDDGIRSCVTFIVYLNDGYEGGETFFKYPVGKGDVLIKPEKGKALLFIHKLLHEGRSVQSGIKYALRSDIYYKKLK